MSSENLKTQTENTVNGGVEIEVLCHQNLVLKSGASASIEMWVSDPDQSRESMGTLGPAICLVSGPPAIPTLAGVRTAHSH